MMYMFFPRLLLPVMNEPSVNSSYIHASSDLGETFNQRSWKTSEGWLCWQQSAEVSLVSLELCMYFNVFTLNLFLMVISLPDFHPWMIWVSYNHSGLYPISLATCILKIIRNKEITIISVSKSWFSIFSTLFTPKLGIQWARCRSYIKKNSKKSTKSRWCLHSFNLPIYTSPTDFHLPPPDNAYPSISIALDFPERDILQSNNKNNSIRI